METFSNYTINRIKLDNRLSNYDLVDLFDKYRYAYFCKNCGYIQLLDEDKFYKLKFDNKSCSHCKTKNYFEVNSIQEIIEKYELFKRYSYSFISGGREYGIYNTAFDFRYGGTVTFSLELPFFDRKIMNFENITMPVLSKQVMNSFLGLFYKSKLGFDYIELKESQTYPRANLYNCVCVIPYFDNMSIFSYDSMELAIIKNGDLESIGRNVRKYVSIYKENDYLVLHLIEYTKDYQGKNLRYNLINDSKKYKTIDIDRYGSTKVIEQQTFDNNLIKEDIIYFYFSYDYSVRSNVLVEYCRLNNLDITIIQNHFDDDPTINYCIKVNRKERNHIFFVYYTLLKSGFALYRIYSISLTDILFCKDKDNLIISKLNIDSTHSELCNYISEKLKCALNLNKQDLLNYFIDSFGLYIVDKHYFNHTNNINIPLFYGFDNSRSLYSDYMLALAKDSGYIDKQMFYESEQYRSFKLYFDQEYTKIKKLEASKSKYKNEFELYNIVKFYYPDTIYQFQLSTEPVIRVDVYIPSLNIIIEYQGKQHYEEVDYFLSANKKKNLLSKQIKRDVLLREIATTREIKLIEWPYTLDVNPLILQGSINSMLNSEI